MKTSRDVVAIIITKIRLFLGIERDKLENAHQRAEDLHTVAAALTESAQQGDKQVYEINRNHDQLLSRFNALEKRLKFHEENSGVLYHSFQKFQRREREALERTQQQRA